MMIFPLVTVKFNTPPAIPGRPGYRDMPIAPLFVSHGNFTLPGKVFIDSMSDFVLLPDWVAAHLQIDLTHAPSHTITLVGGGRVGVRFAEVVLELRNPRASLCWPATIAFGPTQR